MEGENLGGLTCRHYAEMRDLFLPFQMNPSLPKV
jgi:hypothetical protein